MNPQGTGCSQGREREGTRRKGVNRVVQKKKSRRCFSSHTTVLSVSFFSFVLQIEHFPRKIVITPCSISNTRPEPVKDHGRMTNAIATIGRPRSPLLVNWASGAIRIVGPSPPPWICNSPGVNSTSTTTTDTLVTLLRFSRHPADRSTVLRE